MKKNLLLLVFLMMIGVYGFSQVVYSEDFSSGAITGWSGNAANLFKISETQKAGGVVPEMRLSNAIVIFPPVKFISPVIDATGITSAALSFKQYFDFDATSTAPFTFNVLTRKDEASDWRKVDSLSYNSDFTNTYVAFLDATDLDSPTFQFCFEITGRKTQFIEWCIDDIRVEALTGLDLALTSLAFPDKIYDKSKYVSGTVRNVQGTTIHSLDVSWKLNDNITHKTSFSGLNLETGNYFNFTCDDYVPFKLGDDKLTVWISNINGGNDDNEDNNQLEKSFTMVSSSPSRHPMFEVFTSSTCGPCVGFANTMVSWVIPYGDDISVVKYQMNWPGSGDPYYTAEGGVRRTYYGVSAVPDMYCDGTKYDCSASGLQNAYNTSSVKPKKVNINVEHTIDGKMVTIMGSIMPLENLGNAKLNIAVIEKITTQNKGGNGQTEFHDVMMKMVPDASGTAVNLVANKPVPILFSVDMTGTHVEEMSDLRVVVFIQASNKDIYNSGYSAEAVAIAASNIKDGDTNVALDSKFIVDYSTPIYMPGGAEITNANVSSLISFTNESKSPVSFTAEILAGSKTIVVTPSNPLNKGNKYQIKVKAVETTSGASVPGLEVNFKTLGIDAVAPTNEIVGVKVFPNPSAAGSTVEFRGISNVKNITLVNALGKVVFQYNHVPANKFELPGNIAPGVYFVKFMTPEKTLTSRLIIVK